jgi:hypothetical protein
MDEVISVEEKGLQKTLILCVSQALGCLFGLSEAISEPGEKNPLALCAAPDLQPPQRNQ